MIDKINMASRNWAEDYMTRNGRRFNNMLRDSFITGFKKGVELSRKRGKWIEQDDGWDRVYYKCSECGEAFTLIDGTPTDNLYNFCPNCGCRMEGGDEDESD